MLITASTQLSFQASQDGSPALWKKAQVIATTRSPEAVRRIVEAAGGRPTILLSILKEDTLKTRRLLQTELDNDELLEEKTCDYRALKGVSDNLAYAKSPGNV